MDMAAAIRKQAEAAKKAANSLGVLGVEVRNRALVNMADSLIANQKLILAENAKDIKLAVSNGVSPSYQDRLRLDKKRLNAMAEGIIQLAGLPDPLGREDYSTRRPNGLEIRRQRVPLGVVGIIYEARPNVTADAIGLCLKSGNAIILRGGSEALASNTVISNILSEAAYVEGVPVGAIQFLAMREREAVTIMTHLTGLIDVVIPRGGRGLIKTVVANSYVPVIETGTGVCHVYVDAAADVEMANRIIVNAKVSRPSVCNALETLLIHDAIADKALPVIAEALRNYGVELRGCERTRAILPHIEHATDEDWSSEYGELILAIKVIADIGEAIEHINRYNTGHSESIITRDIQAAHKFQAEVDAAVVYVNASTRFTDGYEFGFGAEMGISTQKIHARGPMGLAELTSSKYLVYGDGQIR